MSAIRNYANTVKNPPVTSKLPGSNQVKNNTGGYVFEVTAKNRLERFLILGTDGGSYYVGEKDLTQQNVDFIINLIKTDSTLVLDTVHDVSTNGRSYRNSAAIFVLALVLVHGSASDKLIASAIVPEIARTATMVYELAEYIDKLGGWGRAKRRAISNWFTSKTPEELGYQAVKYRQRNGWTLRDLMRLSHPVGVNQNVGKFILGNYNMKFSDYTPDMPGVVHGFIRMQGAGSVNQVVALLDEFPNLPWETIPTQFLKNPEIWKTLFYSGSLQGQALLRNVVRLSRIDAFNDLKFMGDYAKKLTDKEMIKKTRLHPVQYLLAGLTYQNGQIKHGTDRWGYGSEQRVKDWTVKPKIKDALEAGFYDSFTNVESSGKRIRIGVDVSGSMTWSSAIGSDITAAQGAAAMALVLAKTEDYVEILGFANTLRDLNISNSDSFDSVMRKTSNMTFGSTNPSLLIDRATNDVDAFVVITDNEVNSGGHPSQSLKKYRQARGLDSRLIVMGMTATNFTIADPNDPGMLDVCGFDANVPKVVNDFMNGKI